MKENDFFAVALNTEGTGLSPDDLRGYGINPDNTSLQQKDYYKDIPRVQERFKTSDGKFDDVSYSAFYDSLKRSYSDFAQNDYIDNILNAVPSSAEDIFSLGDSNISDDSVKIISSKDPNRHQIGIGNIFQTGEAAFSEREVAQAYNVLDENGNELDWSPNDKGGLIKSLFRPTLALATWDEDGYHIENGREVFHHKGEHKYDENGNPRYQKVSGEIYDKEILHWGDTITKEGTWLNKIDPFDFDSTKTSAGRVVYSTFVRMLPYLTPAAEVFGAIEAAKALSKTIPVVAKSINGMFGTNKNSFGEAMTSVENWAKRFDQSTSDAAEGRFFAFENIMQQVVDSAKQLYSQGLIRKIPQMLSKHPSMKSMKIADILATTYLATTSSEDVYGDYIKAGVNETWAGIGALATMGAFYGLLKSEYFKEYLFNDPAIELPELKKVIRNEIKTSMDALEKRIASNENITAEVVKKGILPSLTGEKWYNKTYNAVANALNKVIPKVLNRDNTYLVRAANEGLEEVIEEGTTDLVKGLTLGAQAIGFNVKNDAVDSVDFGFSAEDFITRYSQALIGGMIGGAVFEGLQQYNNRHGKQKLISDLNLDEQLSWYIRNGRAKDLLDIVDNFEEKGKFGSKNLSLEYEISDGKIVWNSTDDEKNSQNTQLANALRQKIDTIQSELIALNFVDSDNELLEKALSDIEKEAKREGFNDVNEYKDKRLRDERIDFLKQRQVDKLILSDIADLQHSMRILHEDIIKRRNTLLSRSGDSNRLSEDEIKKDPVIKIKQDKFDEYKKDLDAILHGKNANEYLALGLFAGDDQLVDLYLARKAKDGMRSYYLTDLNKYVRAKYNANLNELIEKSGGRDENGNSEIEEFFKQEFEQWEKAEDIFKIREAYNIHKRLGKIINPILKSQIENYSEYKSDPERRNLINIMMDEESRNRAIEEYNSASAAVDNYINEHESQFLEFKNPDNTYRLEDMVEFDSNFAKLIENRIKAEANLAFFSDPRTVLDRAFTGGDTEKEKLLNIISSGNTDELFKFLEKYYTHLNTEKIVSDFSDDFYRLGIAQAADATKNYALNRLNTQRSNAIRDAYTIPEEFVLIIDRLAEHPALSEIIVNDVKLDENDEASNHSILEIFKYFSDYIAGDSSKPFLFNGKMGRITEHLINNFDYENGEITSKLDDEDRDKLWDTFYDVVSEIPSVFERLDADEDWFDLLKRDLENNANINRAFIDDSTWQSIVSRLIGTLQDFEKDPDYGVDTYQGAIKMIKGLIEDGSFNPGVDAKTWVDKILFDNSPNIADEVNKLKTIRSNMIHTPILDWIRGISTEFGGVKQDLLDLLNNEIKGLTTSKALDEYVINNPFVKDELDYLQNALNAAFAIVRSAAPLSGANFFINKLIDNESDKLPVLSNAILSDVYQQDLNTLYDRVTSLIELNKRNSKGVVRMRLESMAVNAPKLFKTFLKKGDDPAENPKDNPFWIGQFENILHIDINQLWNNRFDLNNVTVDNLESFWDAVRQFMNELYEAVDKVDWTKISAENDNKSVNEILTEVLIGKVTDAWRLQNSTVNSDPDSVFSDLDVGLIMAAITTVDPKEIFGKMKTASEDPSINKKPFWDQMMAIIIGYGKTQNKELFNAITEYIWKSQNEKADNPDDSDFSSMGVEDGQSARAYFKSRPLITNALNIDGSSGTGKSTVVLKFIHYMNELSDEKPISFVCAKYGKRMKALQNILGVSDDSCFTLAEFEKKLIGRELNSDDFVDNTENDPVNNNGHAQQLKSETIEFIKEHTNWGTDSLVNVYIDESGLCSEAELVFFSEVSKLGNVNLIFAGDKMQNGATVSSGKTSGIGDCVILGTPRLNISMRIGNWGMISNIDMLERDLSVISDIYQKTPWITTEAANRELNGILQPRTFKYTERSNAIYGFRIVEDGISALEKLKTYNKNPETKVKIAIITDNPDKYSSNASNDVEVISVEEVQGGEYDYVLSDISNIDESRPDNYYKKVYTIISRAKTGGYIVGNLGSKFNKSEDDPLSSTEINPTSGVDSETDMSMNKYNSWWIEKLMKNDVWGTNTTNSGQSTENTTESTTEEQESTQQGGQSAQLGVTTRQDTQTNPTTGSQFTGSKEVSMPEFNEDEFKQYILENDTDVILYNLISVRSKQKRADIDNYKKYHNIVDNPDGQIGNGTYIDYKSYIDWLFNESDDLLFGENDYNIAGKSRSKDARRSIKELIRNLSLDLLQLPSEELKDKWTNLSTSPVGKWKELNLNETFVNNLKKYVINNSEKLTLYAVKNGNFSYLYVIVDKVALPIAKINGGTYSGWIEIDKSNLKLVTPLTMLSSDGKAIVNPYDEKFTKYANISEQAYLINLDPESTNFTDPDTKRFVTHANGIGQLMVQSTFNTPANKYLTPETVNGTSSYTRVDSTGDSEGRARFMAVSKHITFETYLKYAGYLNTLWHKHKLGEQERNELMDYVSSEDYNTLTQIEDDGKRISALRKSSILQQDSRDLLTTAIMRYFASDNVNKETSKKFFNNINEWISSAEFRSKNDKGDTTIRQKGMVFSLRPKNRKSIKFYIVLNGDKNGYNVYSKVFNEESSKEVNELLIENLSANEYFNFENTNPVNIAEKLFGEIARAIADKITPKEGESEDSKRVMQEEDKYAPFLMFFKQNKEDNNSLDYRKLFMNGSIAFGLATKRIKKVNDTDEFSWFPPFDSDIAELFNGIAYDKSIETFLKNDSIFKYNIIVGVRRIKNQEGPDTLWLVSEPNSDNAWTWDIIEIIPPLYRIDIANEIENTSAFPTLGNLGHAGSTDDKSKIHVTVTQDEDNRAKEYKFDPAFRISAEDLSKYISVPAGSTEFSFNTISRKGDDFYITIDGQKIKISEDGISELLDGMNVTIIGTDVIVKTDEWKLRKTKNGIGLFSEDNSEFGNIKLIDYSNGTLLLYADGHNIAKFNNVDPSIVNDLKLNQLEPNVKFLGISDDVIWFYNQNTKQCIRISQSGRDVKNVTVSGNNIKFDGVITDVPNDILNNLKPLLPSKPITTSVIEQAKKTFGGIQNINFDDPLLLENPNIWAVNNADRLDGIYTWSGKKWTKKRENQVLWAYSKLVSDENGKSPVDIYNSISTEQYDLSKQFDVLKIDNREFKIEQVGEGYVLSELIKTNVNVDQFIDKVGSLNNQEVTSIFENLIDLHRKKNTGRAYDQQKMGELYASLLSLCGDSNIASAYAFFEDNIAPILDDTINCNFK